MNRHNWNRKRLFRSTRAAQSRHISARVLKHEMQMHLSQRSHIHAIGMGSDPQRSQGPNSAGGCAADMFAGGKAKFAGEERLSEGSKKRADFIGLVLCVAVPEGGAVRRELRPWRLALGIHSLPGRRVALSFSASLSKITTWKAEVSGSTLKPYNYKRGNGDGLGVMYVSDRSSTKRTSVKSYRTGFSVSRSPSCGSRASRKRA
jgi:hypothetical protein